MGREHDESATGQEEVYAVVRGSGTLTVDGEEVCCGPAYSCGSIPARGAFP